MTEQHFRIAEIEVSKSPTDEKILGIFRYEGNGQTKKGPILLIIAEISSTLYAYERLLDVLNATAEQTKHLVAGVEQDPVARFEKLIQRLNHAADTFSAQEPTPVAWNRLNIFVIELSPQHICLTGIGHLTNLFLQKQADGSYRTFDLLGSIDQPAEIDPQKPFTALICGDIKPGDLLFVGTTNLERLRQELHLKERLTTLPPVSAALEIKQDLDSRGIPDDFLAAVIACCALEKPAPTLPQKSPALDVDKSTASINKLRAAEQEAQHHLAPSLGPSSSTNLSRLSPTELLKKVTELRGQLTKRLTRRDRVKDVAAMASLRGMNAGHGSLFTKKHQLLSLICVGVLIAGIGLFSWWKHRQKIALEAATWQATFEQAQDNRNRAESDLVYANDGRARTEIETAEKLLAKLETTDPEHKKSVEALKQDLNQLRERLRKIMPAQPITELLALNGVPAGSLSAPVLTKTTAYVVNNAEKTIVKIDLGDKSKKTIALPETAEAIVAGSLGKQSIVFTTAKGTFYALNTQTDALTSLASQPKASSTTDLILYAGRAYSLDGLNGQIWRAQSTNSGFGSEQAYIKAANIPLTNSVGLAIDSNVYVLKADGTLARFLSGGQEGFALANVDPALKAASGLWTVAEGTRLVITDPAEKRILVFNKDGSLRAQLTSPDFTGPRDVDGDEANKRLLVIDGTRLLLVPLP